MIKKIKNNQYLVLVAYSVFLTFVISFFSAASLILGGSDKLILTFQILAFACMAIFFTYRASKTGILMKLLKTSDKKIPSHIIIMLLLIVIVQPLFLGFTTNLPLSIIILTISQMILVGYTEELLFRGIYYIKLKDKNPIIYILFSSFIFGILHSATGINPEANTVLVLLQVVNAFLLGILFAVIYYVTQQIWILMGTHALFNIMASLSNESTVEMNLYAVLLLAFFYVVSIAILAYKYKIKNNL